MNILKMTTGVALVSLFAAAALAHGGATGIVKERMDGMSAMKDSMKVLTPMSVFLLVILLVAVSQCLKDEDPQIKDLEGDDTDGKSF